MDVNEFIDLVNQACDQETSNTSKILPKYINLTSVIDAFSKNTAWADLKNEDSDLVKFLKNEIYVKTKIDVFKLKILGLLWCKGDVLEKSYEFYNIIQDDQ